MNTTIQLAWASPDIQVKYEDYVRPEQNFTRCAIDIPSRNGSEAPIRIDLYLPYQARLNPTVTVEEV